MREGGWSGVLTVVLVVAFGALGVVNVVTAGTSWRGHRARALWPIGSFLCIAVALIVLVPAAIRIGLADTPVEPATFLRGDRKVALKQIAKQLLGHSLRSVSVLRDGRVSVTMQRGAASYAVPRNIPATLGAFGFEQTTIDDARGLVVFTAYRSRTWYAYSYTTGTLDPPYSVSSEILPEDIADWSELIRIARQGLDTSCGARNRIVFEPTVVYPYLRQALGSEALTAIASRHPAHVTMEERQATLRALNAQRLASSRLAENINIKYDTRDRFGLTLGPGSRLSNSFWAVGLLKGLISDGTVRLAADGQHLSISSHLNALQERRVEWLHVGIMNFLYGNLLEVRDPGFDTNLGDGWYFKRD